MKNKPLLSITFFLFVLVLWQVVFTAGIHDHLIIPSPFSTFKSLLDIITKYEYLFAIFSTTARVLASFTISAIVGISLGILLGRYLLLDKLTESFVDVLRSIPSITLFPVFILFFGISETSPAGSYFHRLTNCTCQYKIRRTSLK